MLNGFRARDDTPSMDELLLFVPATDENFDEDQYFTANPDVKRACDSGGFACFPPAVNLALSRLIDCFRVETARLGRDAASMDSDGGGSTPRFRFCDGSSMVSGEH